MDGADDLPKLLADIAKPGGAIVCLGAGSITQWAGNLESALKERETQP
jgi:UDP-N-acetylmuramate--alanine ligase